jgi:GNAT superfamily N-acetyltransferase
MESGPGIEERPARPQPDGSDVRKVTEADVPRLVEALARAFDDDPMVGWLYPDSSRRRHRLLLGFDLFLRRLWLPHDECYTTDRLAGGALWMPPGTWRASVFQQLRLLPATVRFAGRDFFRFVRFANGLESKHPRDPHYYLPVIGVEPQWQGKGFGAAVLRPILERCDREGLPAYLEASSLRSRALYERNGFELVEEFRPARDAPPLWLMWRTPRSVP